MRSTLNIVVFINNKNTYVKIMKIKRKDATFMYTIIVTV